MAENNSGGERTESATPKKREDARERGNVLKSNEVVVAGSLMVMFAAMKLLITTVGKDLVDFSRGYLLGNAQTMEVLTTSNIQPVMQHAIFGFLQVMLPILAIALLVGVLLNVVQTGLLFSTKALGVKMERMNPMEGFKRMFSVRSLFELGKSIIKIVAIGFIIYSEIMENMTVFPLMMSSSVEAGMVKMATIVTDAAFKVCGVLLAIAVLDYFFQRKRYEKDLMMSKYEVKMEYKQQEGDPQVKQRIRQKQRQMSMMRMMQDVPDADVVITNPTHYAIALVYDDSVAAAPKVVAKGKDLIALKIKEIAKENDVVIMENKPLAQSLYAMCEIGEYIPVDLYQAVAEILAQVYRIKNKR